MRHTHCVSFLQRFRPDDKSSWALLATASRGGRISRLRLEVGIEALAFQLPNQVEPTRQRLPSRNAWFPFLRSQNFLIHQ